jgi:hypothetical protein
MPAAPVPNSARLSSSGVAATEGGEILLPPLFPLPPFPLPPFPLPLPPGAAAIGLALMRARHSRPATVTSRTRSFFMFMFMRGFLVRWCIAAGVAQVAPQLTTPTLAGAMG